MGNHFIHHEVRQAAHSAETMNWALMYACQNLPILPMYMDRNGNKRPYVRWKELGVPKPEQVKAWWHDWPLAMIGMKTGMASGYVVLDVDVKNGVNGFETLDSLGISIPKNVLEVVTPTGGRHFYFAYEEELLKAPGAYGPGLDIRTDGQLIILPPSRATLGGGDYHFAQHQTPEAMGHPMGVLYQ